jgi:hypothetical protein
MGAMNADLLLKGLINMLLLSVVVEGAVAAVFSLTAMRMIEAKRTVQTSREVLTFLVCLLFVYTVEPLRLMKSAGINFPMIGDIIISSMVLSRLSGFIRDLMNRIRSGS